MPTATLPARQTDGPTPVDFPVPVTARPSVVDRLRGDARRRPVVDAGLAGGLRAWLEDGVATVGQMFGDQTEPVVVDRRTLEPGPWTERGPITATAVRGAMVGALFGQIVLTGQLSDPFGDGLAGLDARGRTDLVAFVRGLPGGERRALERTVRQLAGTMAGQWATVAHGWQPRVAARLTVPLAGGRVVLRGIADLVLGAPSDGRASICLVDVRSGEPQPGHRRYRGFLALLETIRSGAPPFRTATYYPASGDAQIDDVTDDLLAGAVGDVLGVVAGWGGTTGEAWGVRSPAGQEAA